MRPVESILQRADMEVPRSPRDVEVRNAALALVKERLAGKTNKQYGGNHVLVVVVDDYLPFRTEEDQEILMKETQSIVAGMKLNFGAVYLLGSSGKYCARVSGEI
jgi:hypothetical protein